MRFDEPFFVFEFLPLFLALYFLVRSGDRFPRAISAWTAPLAVVLVSAAGALLIARSRLGWPILAAPISAWTAAVLIERLRPAQRTARWALVAAAITVSAATFGWARWLMPGRDFAFAGIGVLACLAIAFVVDVARGQATTKAPLSAALYLLQFPVMPAGPLTRYRDFSPNVTRLAQAVGLGAFTYGARRIVLGFVKIVIVAGSLAVPVDAIVALPAERLRADIAWLAAVCLSLQWYFVMHGYADLAIGIGRMLGFRYPENFRRPYLADSLREFWRSWSITSIAWLRDYLSFPIAGRDLPTPRLFLNIVVGFALIGLWHGGLTTVPVWALYSGGWLALEAVGLGASVSRLPRPLRHVYVLIVVAFGWVLLRADSLHQAGTVMNAMVGTYGWSAGSFSRYMTLSLWLALITAVIGAGPLVPSISRWRVTVDASTTAVLMMLAAVVVYWWRGSTRAVASARALWARAVPR